MADACAGVLQPLDVGAGRLVAGEQQEERRRVGAGRAVGADERRTRARHALARRLLGDAEQPRRSRRASARLEAQQQDESLVGAEPRERLARGIGLARLGRGDTLADVVERNGGPPPRRRHSSIARFPAVRWSHARWLRRVELRGIRCHARANASWRTSSAASRSPPSTAVRCRVSRGSSLRTSASKSISPT